MCSFEGVDAGGRAGGSEADTEQAERKRCGRGKAERQGKQSQRKRGKGQSKSEAGAERKQGKSQSGSEAGGRRQPKISGGNGWRDHLFPSRTQMLSLHALMVLGWTRPGRVGRCRNPVYGEGNFSV